MKARRIRDMKISKAKIERGEEAPAQVWDLRPDGKGGFKRRALDPEAFQRDQRMAWDKTITSTRHKLGLSQLAFANLLGISVRTLHHWEQGTRTPTGAARVLLRIAANNPDLVIKAAA